MSFATVITVITTDKNGSETIECPCCNQPTATGGHIMGGNSHYFCWECETSIFTDSNRNITKTLKSNV
jgi:transposase-like protein